MYVPCMQGMPYQGREVEYSLRAYRASNPLGPVIDPLGHIYDGLHLSVDGMNGSYDRSIVMTTSSSCCSPS